MRQLLRIQTRSLANGQCLHFAVAGDLLVAVVSPTGWSGRKEIGGPSFGSLFFFLFFFLVL